MKNKQKFVHYTMTVFTYGVGLYTAGAIVYTLFTVVSLYLPI